MGLPLTKQARNDRDTVITSQTKPLALAYPWWRLLVALVVVIVIGLTAAGLGSVQISPIAVIQISLSKLPFYQAAFNWPDSWNTILWELRIPRVLLAGLVGASLALGGATYQGLFRNPLADPYLIGVAGGAGLGATIVLVTGIPIFVLGVSILPIAAFSGALAAVAISYAVARQSDGLPLTTLILAGIAVASLSASVISLLMIRSDPDVKPILGWLLGGFVGTQWRHILMVLPYMIPGVILILSYSRILNLFQVTEEEAAYLGVNVNRAKLVLIAAASLVTAAAVSVSGLIGFVGLIAPHAVRLIWGPDHRFLLPMSLFVGGGFLILADLAARLLVSPGELPVGVVTAFCGAPFFLYLIRKGRRTFS